MNLLALQWEVYTFQSDRLSDELNSLSEQGWHVVTVAFVGEVAKVVANRLRGSLC